MAKCVECCVAVARGRGDEFVVEAAIGVAMGVGLSFSGERTIVDSGGRIECLEHVDSLVVALADKYSLPRLSGCVKGFGKESSERYETAG